MKRALLALWLPVCLLGFLCAPQLHGVRVLVVDDDDDARQMISTVLSRSGAEVRASASASEALTE